MRTARQRKPLPIVCAPTQPGKLQRRGPLSVPFEVEVSPTPPFKDVISPTETSALARLPPYDDPAVYAVWALDILDCPIGPPHSVWG